MLIHLFSTSKLLSKLTPPNSLYNKDPSSEHSDTQLRCPLALWLPETQVHHTLSPQTRFSSVSYPKGAITHSSAYVRTSPSPISHSYPSQIYSSSLTASCSGLHFSSRYATLPEASTLALPNPLMMF